MPNSFFSFKQFTVYHDRCAMKVGTDGVLLGAWAEVSSARNVLDVGTGTGLIALMLAQRCEARITAIDIDPDAVEQATENVAASPWKERVGVELQDVCHYHTEVRYDAIVSNPPYFARSLKGPNEQRNTARHTDSLDFAQLLEAVRRLLAPEGIFSVIIPTDGMELFMEEAARQELHLMRRTWVHTKPDGAPKRVLLALHRSPSACTEQHLTIELARHVYSPEYISLTRDFYLKM